jgi:hypothetical protein
VQTVLALVVLACVLAIGLGTRVRHLRGLASAGAAVLVFVGTAVGWLLLLQFGVVRLDGVVAALKIYRLEGAFVVLVFWGPPALAALATALALRRWAGER